MLKRKINIRFGLLTGKKIENVGGVVIIKQ